MPSANELSRRIRHAERVRDMADEEYRKHAGWREGFRQKIEEAQETLRREDRFGYHSSARRRLRESLLNEIERNQRHLESSEASYQRAKRNLRLRQKQLDEELRYVEEMATLQRIPLPREIVEMISEYNYRGRYRRQHEDL